MNYLSFNIDYSKKTPPENGKGELKNHIMGM